MVLAQSPHETGGYRRRTVLAGLASGAAVAVGAGTTSAAIDGEAPQTVFVPAVSEFEDEYEGQFLTIEGPLESDGSPDAIHDACGDVPWSTEQTVSKVGQLSDRRSDRPLSVRLPIYVNDAQSNLVEDALFVVSDANPCEGEYVRLDVEWVTTRSLVGKPAGPVAAGGEGAAQTDGSDGPGLGVLAGLAGLAGGILALWRRDGE